MTMITSISRKYISVPLYIAWLFPDGSYDNPSNRLRRHQISDYFNCLGQTVKSETFIKQPWSSSGYLVDSPAQMCQTLERFDVVVIFNVANYDAELIRLLRAKNKVVIFDHCENIFGLGAEDEIMKNVSAITCCSNVLADKTEKYLLGSTTPIFIIPDPVDNVVLQNPNTAFNFRHNRPDRALIMGMGANVQYVLPFLEVLCKKTGYEILIMTEKGFPFPYPTLEWNLNSWVHEAIVCSIALCFHDINQFPAKGNIKVTNPMSIGLPVIAPPMESYLDAITTGFDGFIARTEEDWIKYMEELKDPNLRTVIGIRARASAFAKYGMDKVALDYLAMAGQLRSMRK
jgi:hypothetical protein